MSDWFRERRRPLCLKRSELVAASFLLCCVCACTVFYLLPAVAADQHSSSPLVLELRLEGVVDPILATYIDEGLADAANRHAALVLITMDTPGGLSVSMEDIIQHILASLVPVAVYVSPTGGRGASARFDGAQVKLLLKSAALTPFELSTRQKFLARIVQPDVFFVLLILGVLGVYTEFTHPGAIAPGVIGGICLILALYAMNFLPINLAGVFLILLALAFFILEAKAPSHGLLALG